MSQTALKLAATFDSDSISYQERFVAADQADTVLQRLWAELNWTQKPIELFGRRVKQPRLMAWHGDPHATYRYSGITLDPEPWHPALAKLRQQLEDSLQQPFNSVLANAYRDGRDSMGWHADDEKELGLRPTVASISLGAPRRFLLKRRSHKVVSGIELQHGSLLVMKNDCQRHFQHAVPKTRRPVGLRINLTYRNIIPVPESA